MAGEGGGRGFCVVGGGGVGRLWGMKRSHKILRARFIHK